MYNLKLKQMKSILLIAIFGLIGSSVFAQSDIRGTWNTGEQNTLVEIGQEGESYTGKVISSNNDKLKPGTLLIKDVKLKKNKWKGQLYAPKKGEWYKAEFTNKGNILEIVLSVGFMSKTVEWTKEGDK
jgi:uncharacterized protein (DUF2147 family)